jgi:NADH-ubiquinone oxidoreductase chain 6
MIESPVNLLFYLFSSIALVSGVMVITARNPVHSVLFLILVFCNAAGLLILLNLDFFAMIFLVVYVGAIAVLFLFVVMMLNIKLAEINENLLRYLPVGGLIGILFLFEILVVIDNDLIPVLSFAEIQGISQSEILLYRVRGFMLGHDAHLSADYVRELGQLNASAHLHQNLHTNAGIDYLEWPSKIENQSNIEALGQVLYTYYFYYFILASLILLVAMIGCIQLTMHKDVKIKKQNVFEQHTRDFTRTIQKIR